MRCCSSSVCTVHRPIAVNLRSTDTYRSETDPGGSLQSCRAHHHVRTSEHPVCLLSLHTLCSPGHTLLKNWVFPYSHWFHTTPQMLFKINLKFVIGYKFSLAITI